MITNTTTRFVARAFLGSLLAGSATLLGCVNAMDLSEGLPVEIDGENNQEIVGGTSTTIGENPWQISLQTSSGSHFCGGSIIGESYVLTANHCVEGTSASSMRIVAGVTTLSSASQGQIRSVAEVIRYPGYTDPSKGKDVAILRLSSPLNLSGTSVKAIRVANSNDAASGVIDPGTSARVTGWGSLSSGGSSPNTLQTVNVPVVSNTAAQNAYPGETITSDQLGAGIIGTGGKDSCQGDSGGPLTVTDGSGNRVLAGVVSWGYGCADARYPGMYARVTSFASWISGIVDSTEVALLNVSGLSDVKDGFKHYAVQVPSGASNFTASMSGGSGDADLYVRFGSQPTTSTFDCRPYKSGNTESCSFDAPAAGTWYVSVQAYSAYSGLTLTASIRTSQSSGPSCGDNVCSASESCDSCAQDCGTCAPQCGDGVCDASESCDSCSTDCGSCGAVCGDGVCNGDETCSSCSGDCGSCGGQSGTLAFDDFASSTWSGGTGFTGAWTHSGDSALAAGGARLRRSTGDISRTVSTNGASGLTLTFSAAVDSFESSDQAYVKVKADNGAWTTVGTFTNAQSDATWHDYIVDLSAFDGAVSLTVRFDAQMSATSDRFYVDNVQVGSGP